MSPLAATAQDYPTKPITLIVPYAPGGATDSIARIMQDSMSKFLGQQIVIENIGGAGGTIAAARAARTAPDGYTVLLHQVGLAASMSLYKNLTFDAQKDFIPVALINNAASTLATRPDMPAKNLAELIKWMKEPGRTTKIAHPGVGSFGHLAGVLLAQELGIKVTQVPYRGAGPALNDLLASQVDISSQSAVVATPLVKTGKIKAYAIIGRNRFAGLPDLPTLGEAGYKKLDLDFWHMYLVPAGTPRAIVDKLHADTVKALADPDVKKRFADLGVEPVTSTPSEFAGFIRAEMDKYAKLIKEANIKAQ
jgi:tripartite-type tricarboxylate transporter receptor subunit TctC